MVKTTTLDAACTEITIVPTVRSTHQVLTNAAVDPLSTAIVTLEIYQC